MRSIPIWLLLLVACIGLYAVIVPQIAKGKRHAVLVRCLSDWTLAGKPRGEELKQWQTAVKLDQRSVDAEEFIDDHGKQKVAFWIKIEFHKRVGIIEDSTNGLERGTY